MPGFNTIPGVAGGGGQPNMTFVASVHMSTYNRSWAQGGTAGFYGMFSANQENGYVYFVGATTTGGPLNRIINVTHSFTRIDIIAPQNDMVSLYKAKVKSTVEFPNPFAAFASFPSVISTSGNFVLPNNALPLVNALITGGGGSGGSSHHGSGGGGGGGVVKLTAFQAVGTTAITIGGGGGVNGADANGNIGNPTYFGNVYAIGGGGGANHNTNGPQQGGANGGGAGGHGNSSGATGVTQTASTGLGSAGAPVYHGGHTGGNTHGGGNNNVRGGGGGGGGGNGSNGHNNSNGNGGVAHTSDISGTSRGYAAGGPGSSHNSHGDFSSDTFYGHGGRGGGHNHNFGHGNNNGTPGAQGVVVVRYYIP